MLFTSNQENYDTYIIEYKNNLEAKALPSASNKCLKEVDFTKEASTSNETNKIKLKRSNVGIKNFISL